MRTNISTLVTLDTLSSIPNWNECTYTTLLELGSARMPCAILDALERRNWKQVTILCVDWTYNLVDECVAISVNLWLSSEACPCWINSKLLVFATTINGSIVLVHNVLTLLAIRLNDEVLHLFYSLLNGDNTGDAEECRLEDGVGTVAETNLLSNLGSVDVVNLHMLLCKNSLNLVGDVVDEFLAVPNGVEQECAAILDATGNIVHVEVCLLVASHEVRCGNQIGRTDRIVTETEVRAGEATRLLRVIREVCLAVLVGGLADDLYRVLVSTYGTVSTEAEELGLEHAGRSNRYLLTHWERSEGDVVHDTKSEVVLGLVEGEVVISGDDLSRCGVVRAEAIATTNDLDLSKAAEF